MTRRTIAQVHREHLADAHAARAAFRGERKRWQQVLGVFMLLAGMALAWTLAFLGTNWVYARLAMHPAELLRELVTAFAGLLLLALPAGIFGALHQPREQAAFRSILSAIGRIAQGDFRVRVNTPIAQTAHPFRRIVDSINDMAAELDRMEGLRQEFISNVSHEIQSPLTSIKGFAQALRDERLQPAERSRYLEVIEMESERLSRLGDNLLRLAVLEAEESIEPRPYRLDHQLQGIILAAEPQWSQRNIEMEADLVPVEIRADEALLDHVFRNLLHNAIKFTPGGGSIVIRLRRSGSLAAVEVADTGAGIAAEDQERIFERFFKTDRARDRSADGSGLGLALVRRIVDLHQGRITVQSEPGKGSTFRVELPAPR